MVPGENELDAPVLNLLGPVCCPGLLFLLVMAEAQRHNPAAPTSAYVITFSVPLVKASHGHMQRKTTNKYVHLTWRWREESDYLLGNNLINHK